jgi:hypothetical protein
VNLYDFEKVARSIHARLLMDVEYVEIDSGGLIAFPRGFACAHIEVNRARSL